MRAIKADEESSLQQESHYDQRVYVYVAWIDKIPLAAFRQRVTDYHKLEIKAKVEVGDLLVQRTRTQVSMGRSSAVFSNRSLLVQAKITDDPTPVVPVGYMSRNRVTSTSKELALLQHWPEFDLYETSRSRTPILEKIQIDPLKAHSFYGAFNRHSQDWRFGQAIAWNACELEFHEILNHLRAGRIGDDAGDAGQWANLTHAILRAARNRKIPPHLNAVLRDRVQTVEATIAGVDLRPFVDFVFPRKLAVLMIDQVDFEGHNIDEMRTEFPE